MHMDKKSFIWSIILIIFGMFCQIALILEDKQIWLSSPFSGPRRFEFNEANNKWIDIHNSNNSLLSLISKEINEEIIKRKYPSNSKLSLL